ncbi:MAG: hypothetical protein ABR608_04600 [Pseudonocardiaceae bacterium]
MTQARDNNTAEPVGRCSLVLARKSGGDWFLYPHEGGGLGVRLSGPEVRRVAQAILSGGER